jgi:CRISP-associated protein Cas1
MCIARPDPEHLREKPPERRSVDQLRGIEGARVKQMYKLLAKQYGVQWNSRNYDVG